MIKEIMVITEEDLDELGYIMDELDIINNGNMNNALWDIELRIDKLRDKIQKKEE